MMKACYASICRYKKSARKQEAISGIYGSI